MDPIIRVTWDLGDSRGPVCMAGLFVVVAVWWLCGAAVLAFWGNMECGPFDGCGVGI